MIISLSTLLVIKNFSEQICTENQNTHFMFNNFFRKSCPLWGYVGNIVDRVACWVTKATSTNPDHVILIAFPPQQWLNKRGSMLRYTYIICLVIFASTINEISPQHLQDSSLCTCSNVHICTVLSCLFGQVNSTDNEICFVYWSAWMVFICARKII
jgi:hypothetical protein